ncbi:MAG: hypothetical protein ACKOA8_15185, partial [Deltaproteobacteria bacterium]
MKTEASSIRPIYRGLLLTTLSTLMYQLVLTRIFSVTMFYHFSFMAVSITMFGMTVGAIIVYLAKSCFPNHLAQKRMGQFSLLFAALIVGTFFTHLSIPFVMKMKLIPLWSVAVNYFILSLPFVASGITVSIALTQFPERIGKLYAVDLIGAGLGCLATVVVLNYIDAPTLVLIIALVAALGGISYLDKNSSKVQRYMGYSLTSAIFLLTLFCVYSSYKGSPQINLTWVKGKEEVRPLYEKWNAFSRIAVWDNDGFPDGWGISSRYLNTK